MQRAVLVALERRTLTNPGLALAIFGDQPTDAQMVSLRRAVRSLERRGLVTVSREHHYQRLRNTVRGLPVPVEEGIVPSQRIWPGGLERSPAQSYAGLPCADPAVFLHHITAARNAHPPVTSYAHESHMEPPR